MGPAAVIVVLVTMGAGVIVLGVWSAPSGERGDRRSAAAVTAHVSGALVASTATVVYVMARSTAVGDTAVGALVATIGLGALAYASSRSRRFVPGSLLLIHGLLAASALLVVIGAVTRG